MQRTFVAETDEHIRPRVIALCVLVALALGGGGYASYSLISGDGLSLSALKPNFSSITPLTLFYSGAVSGLFFVPVPLEIAYLSGVGAGSPVVASTFAVVGGFIIGNLISYVIGWKLSRAVMHLISAKKLYGLRRKVNRYGNYAVFLVNVLPGPAPQLTFGLGMARYNISRLFFWLVLGNVVKFSAIGFFVSLT